MSEWCQNKRCPEKKNQNQIRGSKGAKYYQSNKVGRYGYGHWCCMGCREQWWNEHKDTCMQAVGFIDKQIVPLEDAWFVEYRYNWNTEEHDRYHLVNKLKGVDQNITREQAQTPEQIADGHSWLTVGDIQARELAVTLGLAS
tara:strand:- start:493 stop:918 length:426 start_codon:yes stop_codon:yes gene_type:complete